MRVNLQTSVHYEQSIITSIQARRSVRTYAPTLIPASVKEALLAAMEALRDEGQRFAWSEYNPGSKVKERLGTYGFIKGAHAFLLGILPRGAKRDRMAAMRFGFRFEQLILKATELDMGTCWLGGTFNPLMFAVDARLKLNEQIVIASPVGYPSDSPHLIHEVSVQVARSRRRMEWAELFFDGEFGEPLTKEAAGEFAVPLEMAQLAPSAVNSQPWRVVRDARGYHFFGAETRYYGVKKSGFLRDNDIGIAMAHFALVCRELKLCGSWEQVEQNEVYKDMTYFATWTPNIRPR